MNYRTLIVPAVLVASIALTGFAASAAYSGQHVRQAKVNIKQARAIALRAVPGGKIVDQELEKEAGGSGLRYSFDVKVKGQTHEVGVDAKTGKVLENAVEGANPD